VGGACNIHGRDEIFILNVMSGKPHEKRPFGRSRRRWKDNILMDLKRDRMGGCG